MSVIYADGTTYLIRSKLNGFVLDITGSNTAACTQIISYPANGEKGTSNQQWQFVPVANGAYLIQSALNHFVIDITGSNTAPITPVISYPSNGAAGTSNQQWELIPVPGAENTYLIKTRLNGFVLDIEGSNQSPRARIISYPMNGATGTPNQHWELVEVAKKNTVPDVNTTYLIKSQLNGFVLDIEGSNQAPCTPILSYPTNGEKGTPNQQWRFIPVGDGTYLIRSVLHNFVIDITGSNQAPCTRVISYPVNGTLGTPNQQWILVPVPNTPNLFMIKTKLNGFVLDIEGGNTAPCAHIISYPMNGAAGTANQHWELLAVSSVVPVSPVPPTPIPVPTPEPTPVPVPPAPVPVPPVPTPVPEPTPIPVPTPVDPETTPTAVGTVGISHLEYKGQVKRTQSDEFIEIRNNGATAADLSDWKITSAWSSRQFFTFPKGTSLAAGQSFRVYTNEVHPESGGFKFGSATAIWNDKGDEAKLFDASGKQMATLAYGLNSIQGIKTELNVLPLQVIAEPAEINRQMAIPGKVTFTEAFRLALLSYLQDNVPHVSLLGWDDDVTDKAAAIKRMQSLIALPSSKITLLTPATWSEDGAPGTHLPDGEETLEQYWIFQLFLEEYDSFRFTAVVDRAGKKPTLNYGQE